MIRIGLDFDGVICDVETWAEENGIPPDDITESLLADAEVESIPPIDGAFDVLDSGKVVAIITHRKDLDPVREWLYFWYGDRYPKVVFPQHSKGFECFKRDIEVFVDDDPSVIKEVDRWDVVGLLYDTRKDGNLYNFLVRKGVL